MTTTESQEIADLFRNPRKVHRSLPFKKISSHTYGKSAIPAQHEGPGPVPDPGEPSKPRPDENWQM
jgi:hypothetical protein